MPWLRRPATRLTLDVPLPPERVEEYLRRSVTPVRSLIFSLPRGSELFVGRLEEGRFAMRVRHGYSNGLTRLFDGQVTRTAFGARLEGRFTTLWFVVLILRLVWLALLLPSAGYLIEVMAHARAGGDVSWAATALALMTPLVTLVVLVLIEAFGRRLGDRDEDRMRRHLAGLLAE